MNPAGLIVVGVGALLLAVGLYLLLRTRSFLSRAVPVSGTVVDFRVSRDSEGDAYQPVVSYQTTEGETHRFTDSLGTSSPGFSVGEAVPVAYDPRNPKRAKITKPFRLWFVGGLLSSLGGLFVVMGVVMALVLPT